MVAIVTLDVKDARRIVVTNPRCHGATYKHRAHRLNRRVERMALFTQGPAYERIGKPRLTAWDLC